MASEPYLLVSEDSLRARLDEARAQIKRNNQIANLISWWMTDCAARTVHIYETASGGDALIRHELTQIQNAGRRKGSLRHIDITMSWLTLNDIALQLSNSHFTAAAWAVRSVAWTLKDIRTAWNCAAAALHAVAIAFPELEAAERAWQADRLNKRLENDTLSPLLPGYRYHQ